MTNGTQRIVARVGNSVRRSGSQTVAVSRPIPTGGSGVGAGRSAFDDESPSTPLDWLWARDWVTSPLRFDRAQTVPTTAADSRLAFAEELFGAVRPYRFQDEGRAGVGGILYGVPFTALTTCGSATNVGESGKFP